MGSCFDDRRKGQVCSRSASVLRGSTAELDQLVLHNRSDRYRNVVLGDFYTLPAAGGLAVNRYLKASGRCPALGGLSNNSLSAC